MLHSRNLACQLVPVFLYQGLLHESQPLHETQLLHESQLLRGCWQSLVKAV